MRRSVVCALVLAIVPPTLGSGCAGARVRRHAEAGEHAAAVAEAEGARRPVRGKAARALARSYGALGRFEAARAVLQRDYRHGGELESLVALARAELDAGLLGIGTAHYARAMELDYTSVEGDERACAAFVARAVARHGLGDAVSADADLRRAAKACPSVEAATVRAERDALWARIRPVAQAQVERRRQLESCPAGGCPPLRRAQLEEELAARVALARAEGARALARLADEGVSLPAGDIARLVDAELHGEVTTLVVDDGVFAQWVGGAATDDVIAASDAIDRRAGAYARLRLQRIRGNVARGDVGSERQSWLLAAANGAGGWRALIIAGRTDEAELELVQTLRAQRVPASATSDDRTADRTAANGAPAFGEASEPPREPVAGDGPTSPAHWAAEVHVDDISLPELLALSRMLELRDRSQLGFELRRHVLARAFEADVAGARERWHEAVATALAEGRPWRAWVLASLDAGPQGVAAARAAATQINLRAVACADGCEGDAGRSEAARIMGDAWVSVRADRVASPETWRSASSSPPPSGAVAACEVRASMLSPDDPMGQVLWRALEERVDVETGAPEPSEFRAQADAERLAATFESDRAMGCRGWVVGRLLAAFEFRVVAERLAERYGHLANVASPTTLEGFAAISLAANRPRQAQLWVQNAAALDPDPLAVWRRAEIVGRELHAREYELHALRQQLLHTRGHEGLDVRRQLVVSRLSDVAEPVDPEASVIAPAEDAVRAALDEHFDRLPAAMRWGEAERLMDALVDRGVSGPGVAMRLTPVLSTHAPPEWHTAAWSKLMGLGAAFEGSEADPEAPPIDAHFLDARSLARRNVAATREAVNVEARLAMVAVGSSDTVASDVATLLEVIEPGRRAAVAAVLWRGATAWREASAERIIDDDETALSVVLAVATGRT